MQPLYKILFLKIFKFSLGGGKHIKTGQVRNKKYAGIYHLTNLLTYALFSRTLA